MTTTTTATIDGFLSAIRGEHGDAGVWADDAVLDAVVPNWRMAVGGSPAVERQLRAWYRHPGTLEELRRHPTERGEVVQFTVTWVEDGVPHAARQVHVLEFAPDGRIAHDDMWCGGRWPASLLAEMADASHAD